jgi:peptidoglycan/xylan/chitin deacetylase (PgdA/CDA1 family)/glycosyltransferase involved in cell wall biosynthesis
VSDVAVVIPCFNLGHTVEDAVDSVLAQTRPAAEIVVVDDGSTDPRTRQRLASLSRPRLRVVRIEHRGASAARNHGAALTSAPYLLFVDADDALDRTYLEKSGARLDAEPELDVVSTAMRAFGEATYVWTPPPPDLTAAFTRGTIPITALMRRRVWDTVGGFDEALPASMDLDFWIRAFDLGFRGDVLDEPLLQRRVRSDSLHHAAVGRGAHWPVLQTIFRKHRGAIERLGPALLVAKDAFIEEQRSDGARLEERRAELRAELAHLDQSIGQLQRSLRERDVPIVDFGDFRRLDPISPFWGVERGHPVDRYYIERFLQGHGADIRGRVLEIKDPTYAERFGQAEAASVDVLDIVADNPRTTIVADLSHADAIPSDSFDCFILTQTLHIIFDVRAAIFHAHRILRPGGVLLATLPAVSRINPEDGGLDAGDYWRFTEASLRQLFGEHFAPEHVEVLAGGNLKACIAFLYGLAHSELTTAELDRLDPRCPLVFCVRAVKSPPRAGGATVDRRAPGVAAILMYHRIAELDVDPHGLCVSPSEFRAHMQHLAERYRVVSVEDLAREIIEGGSPDGAVAISFDDGTLDALENASPILTELGLPATFFVNTERLDEAHEPWWDVLARIVLGGATTAPALALMLDGHHVFPTADASERAAAYASIHRWMMQATLSERDRAMQRITEWSGRPLPPRRAYRLLLGDEIRQLAQRPGHTIGAHSVDHLFLPAQSAGERHRQVDGSKQVLQRLLGRPVTLFSYPFGAYDADLVERVKAAGYVGAVTTERRAVSASDDIHLLPRLDVKGGGVRAFADALAHALAAAPARA